MDIGRLDTRVAIEFPDIRTGTMGDRTPVGWVHIEDRWASVKAREAGGSEGPEADQTVARHQYTVRMRYNPKVTPKHRLRVKNTAGTILHITSVAHVQARDHYTEILAIETKAEDAV